MTTKEMFQEILKRLENQEAFPLFLMAEEPAELFSTNQIQCPDDVYRLCKEIENAEQEVLMLLMLNTRNYLIKREVVTVGILDQSLAHPREIFKRAIRHNASSIILVHNHPGGCLEPSGADLSITKQIASAGKLLDIPLHDHIIIGKGNYISLKARGCI